MEISEIVEKLVLIFVLFAVTLGIAAYSTYFERKVAAWFQDRIGPDRAGPFGILQPLADGGKLFFKEDLAIIDILSKKSIKVNYRKTLHSREAHLYEALKLALKDYVFKNNFQIVNSF